MPKPYLTYNTTHQKNETKKLFFNCRLKDLLSLLRVSAIGIGAATLLRQVKLLDFRLI